MCAAGGKVVCVTGASGYIASWLVKLLLEKGYTVKATVRNLDDPKKTEHLRQLEGASERLHLFKANLLEEGSFDVVVDGCEGAFHTASPCYLNATDPQAELIDPAVKGTLNVLRSCTKVASIKRVVITSSVAAVSYNERPRTPDVIVDETWFSSPEHCKANKEWYVLSKTLAEEAAWKFAKENGIDIVTINPAMVIGPLLQPTLNTSAAAILNIINGASTFPNFSFCWINVRDVAIAHILAFEDPSASGRYCLAERVAHYSEIVDIIRKLYPGLQLPDKCADDKPFAPTYQVSKEKATSLGITYTPLEESLKGRGVWRALRLVDRGEGGRDEPGEAPFFPETSGVAFIRIGRRRRMKKKEQRRKKARLRSRRRRRDGVVVVRHLRHHPPPPTKGGKRLEIERERDIQLNSWWWCLPLWQKDNPSTPKWNRR